MKGMAASVVTTTVALLCAMAVGSLLIMAYGQSPAHVYYVMIVRTWGDSYGLGQVLFRATPLLFTGLAVALAFHAGLFNVGAEGQLLVGSFVTAIAGAALPASWPAPLSVTVCVSCGVLAGGLVGALPGALRAWFGAHEVISGIMLNFIAQAMVLWAGRSLFFAEQTVHTRSVAVAARLPSLGLAGSAASLAFVLGLVLCVGVGWFLFRTRVGYDLRAFGHSPGAAEAGGIDPRRTIVLAMTLSGALAGLVGTGTVLGYKGYFEEGMGSGAGFMGIAVALLGRNHPVGIVLGALLLGTLAQGGLAANALVPKELVEVLEAVLILTVALLSSELRRFASGLVSSKGAAA
jgi:simple sugar transport system permease protein